MSAPKTGSPTKIKAEFDALQTRTQYILALVNRVHMLADPDDESVLIGLAPLIVGTSLQADCNARANALQASLVAAHFPGVGTLTVAGEHEVADTTNGGTLAAVPLATSSPTCITLINALRAAVIAHGNQAGVHFHDDTSASGSTFSYTGGGANPPVTLNDQIHDLNDIRQALLNHYSLASQ